MFVASSPTPTPSHHGPTDDEVMSELNEFLKEAAERFLPLLGDDIQLASFLARDVLAPDVSAGQIDEIVSDIFGHARQRMMNGGVVFLRTGNAVSESETDLMAPAEPSYVMVTLEFTASEIQTSVPRPPEALLRRLRNTIEPARGFICFNQNGARHSSIEIHLPVLQRVAEFNECVPLSQKFRRLQVETPRV
jgi:hypothetical protein